MFERRRPALSVKMNSIVLVALIALGALSGCGGGGGTSDSGSGPGDSSQAAAGKSSQYHAGVLDKRVAATPASNPAIEVPVEGGAKISFEKGEPLKVAFFGYGRGYAYTTPNYEGAEGAAKELGIELSTFDPAGDPQAQLEEIRTAIASGRFNAAVVYPLTTALDCKLVTEELPDANILVATVFNRACPGGPQQKQKGILTWVKEIGAELSAYEIWAERIADEEKGGKAIVIVGPEIDEPSKLAVAALQKKLKGSVEILDEIYSTYEPSDSQKRMQDALQANPEANLIISDSSEVTQGATTAVRLAGKEGQIKVYDFGAGKAGIKLVEEGDVVLTVPQYPYTMVKTAVQALALARQGVSVPPVISYAGHVPERTREKGSPIQFITPENAKQYREEDSEY